MSGKRVLVVDDEKEICEIFKYYLGNEGYVVDGVLNCDEALEKMKGEPYDIVFIDLHMPGSDGIETTKKLKAQSPDTPMVLMTGKVSGDLVKKELEFENSGGIVRYFLYKPLGKEEILSITRKVLTENMRPG